MSVAARVVSVMASAAVAVLIAGGVFYVRACSATVSGHEIPGDRARVEVLAALAVYTVGADGAEADSLSRVVGRETSGLYGYPSSVSKRWTTSSAALADLLGERLRAALERDGFRPASCAGRIQSEDRMTLEGQFVADDQPFFATAYLSVDQDAVISRRDSPEIRGARVAVVMTLGGRGCQSLITTPESAVPLETHLP